VLDKWIAATRLSIETISGSAVHGLTPAELRVLQFLPTHLSYPQIAGEVVLSTNTVKSQAASVYRKLGVTSRRGAVAQAQAAGLLDTAALPRTRTVVLAPADPQVSLDDTADAVKRASLPRTQSVMLRALRRL
jgi:DNA-binding CsgD family transcriptional regulator